MWKLVTSSVRHNVGRYIATLLAIVAGVGFFTAVSVVSDGVTSSLDGNVDEQYGAVSVAVVPEQTDASLTSAVSVTPPTIDRSSVEELLALPDVEAGAGVLTAPAAFADSDGAAFATSATGRLWIDDAELNPLTLSDGQAPAAAGEIAVDVGLAEGEDITVGDEMSLLTSTGPHPVTVVGLTEFGDSDSIDGGGTISVSADDAFGVLTDEDAGYTAYYLRGSGNDGDLAEAAQEVIGEGLQAQTGEEFREDQRQEAGSFVQTLKRGLQAFAVLALLVGGFVIYNTFSVIVAQRLRELAVLAAIGATPRQLKRTLRLEGLVLGLLGSLLGIAAGYGLTVLLQAILAATGNELPGGLTFSPATMVSGVVLGTVITVLSVLSPARKAGRAEPMAALREAAVEASSLGKTRATIAVILLGLGLAGMLIGEGLAVVGAGAVAIAAAVFVGAPYLARTAAWASRPLLHRFGIEGRLAVDNAVRSPKRTATTANALLIGVFLVTLVIVSGSSLRDFIVEQVNDAQAADFVASSEGGVIDEDFAGSIGDIDHVDQVVPFTRTAATVDGETATIASGDLDRIREVASVEVQDGSLEELDDDSIAVVDFGDEATPAIGDTVTITAADGSLDLRVVAILAAGQDTVQLGSLVSLSAYEQLGAGSDPSAAFITLGPDATDATRDAVNDAADLRPDIMVLEGNAIGQLLGTIMDFLIQAVTGLLLMSVVIALIGIVNTMSLSILERRRELGLLRIIGMTDRRVRRMIRLESVLISLIGTVSGVVLGLGISLLSVLAINRSGEADLELALPILPLVAILVVGFLLGVLASLLPSRRSTRLDVLDAVAAS